MSPGSYLTGIGTQIFPFTYLGLFSGRFEVEYVLRQKRKIRW